MFGPLTLFSRKLQDREYATLATPDVQGKFLPLSKAVYEGLMKLYVVPLAVFATDIAGSHTHGIACEGLGVLRLVAFMDSQYTPHLEGKRAFPSILDHYAEDQASESTFLFRWTHKLDC